MNCAEFIKAFKAMDDEAADQAKKTSSELADFVKGKVSANCQPTQ
jgi:hypothetical protein